MGRGGGWASAARGACFGVNDFKELGVGVYGLVRSGVGGPFGDDRGVWVKGSRSEARPAGYAMIVRLALGCKADRNRLTQLPLKILRES